MGESVPRKEDDRYLRGMGEFVGDIRLHDMIEMAFTRSPVAHARVLGIRKPAGRESQVLVAADLVGVKPITAVSGLPGFKPSPQPILASDKVLHVGEALAICLAATRAEAEDIADAVELDLDELPAVSDMRAALVPGAPLLHEAWGKARAPIVVRRRLRTARQCMSPIEGRGVVAVWDRRLEQLLIYSSTQQPHIVRTGLSECLGLPHEAIRVIAPDVGGGFGYKGILLPEEVCAGFLARQLPRTRLRPDRLCDR